MAGYSGTPLFRKLGIKAGNEVHLAGAPEHYFDLVAPLPAGVRFVADITESTDIVHFFSARRAELVGALGVFRATLNPSAVVWVSWPKKSSKVPTDITEDVIREVGLPLGFVDVKVCAVDEVWSGLKLVVRKELR